MANGKNIFRSRKGSVNKSKIKTPPVYRTVHTSDVDEIMSDAIRIIIVLVIFLIIGLAFWPELSRLIDLAFA